MVKLTEITEEERDSPKPKKQRRDSISEDIDEQQQEDDEDEEEELHDEGDEEDEEIGDQEEDEYYEEEGQVLLEDEKSDETLMIDEECNDQHELKEENQQRFFLTDLEFFDCTVCFNRLSAPIVYLCEHEHVVCRDCFSSSSVCTICTPSTTYKRCRILEKILSSIGESCKNLRYGCKRPVHFTMKVDHERFCKFTPCSCPVPGCSFTAPSTQLSMHLSNDHSNSTTRFSLDRVYSVSLGCDEQLCILQEISSGEMFVITNAKHDIGNMVSVSQIGPCNFRSPFCLELNAKDGKRHSLQFKCEIQSVRSISADGSLIRDFLLVPSRYFEGSEGLELLIRITHSIH